MQELEMTQNCQSLILGEIVMGDVILAQVANLIGQKEITVLMASEVMGPRREYIGIGLYIIRIHAHVLVIPFGKIVLMGCSGNDELRFC